MFLGLAGTAGFVGGGNRVVAATIFDAVAAGDASANDAILWTRATDALTPGNIALTAQISTAANFSTINFSLNGSTDSINHDSILKLNPTGLASGTQYYYRFIASDTTVSPIGTFKTAPAANSKTALHFGFSGDADGKFRPYQLTKNFGTNNLDFFVFLGDTMYESASTGSAATIDTGPNFNNTAQILTDYRRKYLEQLKPVNSGGQSGLTQLFAGQGNYTVLDNHELGIRQFINGGASQGTPVGKGVTGTNSADFVNTTGAFINKTNGFKTLVQAYSEYQPIKETLVSAPGDARTDGTQKLYNANQWGKNALYLNLDDRSYRDVQMKVPGTNVDDTGVYAGNNTHGDDPNRTMLGATQLTWLQQQLLTAQGNGTKWKIISVSAPIDQRGALPSGVNTQSDSPDSMKSWIGGYRAERNKILKFIADNNIENVVFLSTDDHESRVNELMYQPNPASTNTAVVPHAFTIVAGPLGAGGPDAISNHSAANISAIAAALAAQQTLTGVEPVGLNANFPGLHNVFRRFDGSADINRSAFDFYSPDTENYTTLDISADGNTLSVTNLGITSYNQNVFPEYNPASNPITTIFSFQIDAVPEPTTLSILGTSWVLMASRKRKKQVINNEPTDSNRHVK